MDSSLTKQKPVKLLSELLQEQQEPFCLDVYLSERGHPKGRNGCSSMGNSSKDSHGLKRRKKILPCPKILKSVLNKLVSNKMLVSCKDELKTSSFDASRKTNISVKGKKNHHHVPELDRFSSASSMTICDSSCSESDVEDEFSSPVQQNQISSSCTDASQIFKLCQLRHQGNATQQCGCLEESKQHSPVSVLEELPSDEVSPFHNHMRCCSRSNRNEIDISLTSGFNQTKRVTEDSILSASLWDLLAHSTSVDKQGNVGVKELRKLLETAFTSSSSSSQYKKTKKVLEQTKQLLFDCVREVLESHAKNEERKKLFGAEQIGKIICEQICVWAKQSGNVKNITQLIHSDFGKSLEEWNDFQPQIMKIGIEISNAIVEDMENEIVLDIIESCRKQEMML